jgi:hypothetical protein
MTDLLNIDGNPKTVKGQVLGYMTAIMYLAPYKAAGVLVCPAAELAGCWIPCLNTSGHGGMAKGNATFSPYGIELPSNLVQRARINRTRLYADDYDAFMFKLHDELTKFTKKAERAGLTPVVRLNGTSDIRWENETYKGATLFELFPDLQFYDYTKLPGRLARELPANYHLTVSYSEANAKYAQQCLTAHNAGHSMVVVVRNQEIKDLWLSQGAIDMDEHDLRFLDPKGAIGVLKAKGRAKDDRSGFVLDTGEF